VITLLVGGSGSGKSAVAERLTATLAPPVTYVATWCVDGADADMVSRVAAHQMRRPSDWGLLEVGSELPAALSGVEGTVLVDALGTWVAGIDAFAADAGALCDALRGRSGDSVVVSDEVGQGVHPSTEVGRQFRDALGLVNQAVAAVADEVWLVVAGRVTPLGRPRWDR